MALRAHLGQLDVAWSWCLLLGSEHVLKDIVRRFGEYLLFFEGGLGLLRLTICLFHNLLDFSKRLLLLQEIAVAARAPH